jgi:hypothetical protein
MIGSNIASTAHRVTGAANERLNAVNGLGAVTTGPSARCRAEGRAAHARGTGTDSAGTQ